MRKLLIFLIGLPVTLSAVVGTYCDCTELNETECNKRYFECLWSSQSLSCQAKPQYDIPNTHDNCSRNKKEQCEYLKGCAWTNLETCDVFTQCSDYQVTEATKEQCYLKDSQCVPGATQSDGSILCESGTINCPDITEKSICDHVVKTQFIACRWDVLANSCLEQNYEFCSQITDLVMCSIKYCEYTYPHCHPITCSKNQNATSCTFTRMESIYQLNICLWQNGACADAKDTSHLNATTCNKDTADTFTWRQNSCVPCTQENFIMVLLILIILQTQTVVQVIAQIVLILTIVPQIAIMMIITIAPKMEIVQIITIVPTTILIVRQELIQLRPMVLLIIVRNKMEKFYYGLAQFN